MNYVLLQIIEIPLRIFYVKITEERELILIYGTTLSWWKDAGEGFLEEGNLDVG
jgi:hypothetical protein